MTTTLIGGLKRVLRANTGRVVHECRHCGTSVDHNTDCCPVCGVAEIARYEMA